MPLKRRNRGRFVAAAVWSPEVHLLPQPKAPSPTDATHFPLPATGTLLSPGQCQVEQDPGQGGVTAPAGQLPAPAGFLRAAAQDMKLKEQEAGAEQLTAAAATLLLKLQSLPPKQQRSSNATTPDTSNNHQTTMTTPLLPRKQRPSGLHWITCSKCGKWRRVNRSVAEQMAADAAAAVSATAGSCDPRGSGWALVDVGGRWVCSDSTQGCDDAEECWEDSAEEDSEWIHF